MCFLPVMSTVRPAAKRSPRSAAASSDDFAELVEPIRTGIVHRLVVFFFTFITIHYLLWFPVICGFILGVGRMLTGSWTWAGALLALCLAAYAPSYLDRSQFRASGRPWHWLRRLHFWRLGHEYVGLRLIRTAVLDPAKKYVMAWSPHGIIILSRLAMYGGKFEELFPGVDPRALGASPVFAWPGSREISLWLGAVDASRRVADKVLAGGHSVIVYPGGSKEIFRTDRRSKDTVLELAQVTGFVRLAIEHGAPLVPVAVFNERAAYERVDPPAWLRNFCLKRLRMPLLLFYGRCMSLLPFHIPNGLGVVFGAPLEVPHKPGVSKDDPIVAEVHARYVAAFTELWQAHKGRFGYGDDEKLVIA